jgi:hypothetical protein
MLLLSLPLLSLLLLSLPLLSLPLLALLLLSPLLSLLLLSLLLLSLLLLSLPLLSLPLLFLPLLSLPLLSLPLLSPPLLSLPLLSLPLLSLPWCFFFFVVPYAWRSFCLAFLLLGVPSAWGSFCLAFPALVHILFRSCSCSSSLSLLLLFVPLFLSLFLACLLLAPRCSDPVLGIPALGTPLFRLCSWHDFPPPYSQSNYNPLDVLMMCLMWAQLVEFQLSGPLVVRTTLELRASFIERRFKTFITPAHPKLYRSDLVGNWS